MNNLFKKIAIATVGLVMAIGVGVGIGSTSSGKNVEPVMAALSTATFNKSSTGYSDMGSGAYNSGALRTLTSNGVTLKGHYLCKNPNNTPSGSSAGTYINFQGGNGHIYNVASLSTIQSITLNQQASTNAWTLYCGTSQLVQDSSTGTGVTPSGTAQTTPSASKSLVWNVSSGNYTYFAIKKDNGTGYVSSIVISYGSSTVTLSFNANGHGTAPSSQSITSGGKATEPTAPTATGWNFGGWYKEQACTNAWNFSSDTVSADTTLYAKWTATTYSISYTLNGGTHGTAHPTSGTYDTAFSVSAPTKTGYTFTGWTVTSGLNTSTAKWGTTSSPSTAISSSSTLCVNGTNAVYFKNINAASTAVTLTANWSINSYTVGGSITNGSLSSTSNVNYNAALDITIIPDQDYTYPSSIDSVTMGGADYAGYTYDSTDGSFYIEHVTGNVVINAACVSTSATERFFDYNLTNCSIENAPESMYDTEMKILQIVADDHYKFPSSITVDGISAEKWEYDADEGTILINQPDGNIDITVTCVAKAQNIITIGTLTGVTQKSGDPTTVEEGDIVTLTFIASSGYGLPTSSGVTVTGVDSQSWSWNQNSGELEILGGTSNITVSITAIQRDLTNASLTLGAKKTEYTLGDDFELPTTVTANFNLAPLTVNVKNDVKVTGPVTDDLVVTGSGTITLTYTFATTGTSQTASYSITATPITPTAGGYNVVTASKTDWSGTYVIVSSEYMLGNTISSQRVENVSLPTISEGKITSTVTDAMKWTIASVTGGYTIRNVGNSKYLSSTGTANKAALIDTATANSTWTITYDSGFIITNKSNSESSINATLRQNGTYGWAPYGGSTGNAPILYEYTAPVVKELKWITAEVKSGTYVQGTTVTASNFNVTAHYNDGTNPLVTNDITVTGGYLANVGANDVTLTYGGKSCTVTVTAAEQTATLTGLTWAQGELTIINGQSIAFSTLGTVTATYDIAPSSTKALSACTVSIYTKENETYTKVSDISDGATITSASHGKYLGVSYTEKTVTKVAYSSDPIYVVESINPVYGKVEEIVYKTKVTSLDDLSIGDSITFVHEGETKYKATSYDSSKHVINAEAYTGGYPTDVVSFVVGSDGNDDYTLHNDSGYLMYNKRTTSQGNELYYADEIDDESYTTSWRITFDEDGNAIIKSVYSLGDDDSANDRVIQYNYNSGNPRFSCYRNTQDSIQVYKGESEWVPSGDDIANTNVAVQKAVLEFAASFNDTMDCKNAGTTANITSKWSSLATAFDNLLKSFSGDNLTHCKALFAGADAVEDGDSLQDMLSRYDYILKKYNSLGYDLEDFLAEADRPPVSGRTNINVLNIMGVNNNGTIAVVIISIISVTAIGGYFFLRKKKED